MRTLWLTTVAPVACLMAGAAWAHPAVQGPPSPAPPQNSSAPTPAEPAATPTTGALPPVTASNSAPSSTPQGSEAPPVNQLQEVVVTAQRRAENLQKAAVAVDVVGGNELVKNTITEPTGLGFLVPALTPTPGGFFLRGVGNFTVTPYADPALAFNYDGVYIGRPSNTNGLFYDLQRVEVLKGPQGTLYGRNATGGAINVIPETPKLGQSSSYLTASGGNYGYFNVEAAANVPIGDKTAVRISGSGFGRDGYLDDGTSDEKTRAGRIQVLQEVTPDLTVRIGADYENITGAGAGSTYEGVYRYNPATQAFGFAGSGLSRNGGEFDPASQTYRSTVRALPSGRNLAPIADYPFQNGVFYGVNAEITYDTRWGKLVLEPSYRRSSNLNRTAVPGFTADLNEDDEQYSVETRFLGKRVGIFDYTVGGLYYNETNNGQYSINQQSLAVYQDFHQNTESYAFFGRVTAHLTDALRLVGGLRYTNDDKTFNGASQRLVIACILTGPTGPNCPAAPLFALVPTLAQQSLPFPAASGGATPIIIAGHFTGAVDARGDVNVNADLPTDKVTYRAAVEYDLTPQNLLYFSYETGYRTGGFSLSTGYETYQPETIQAYTWGSKNRFMDNRLQVNLEAFVWKYDNQQVNHVGVDLAGQTGSFTQNIGRSTNQGLEAQGRFLLTPTTVVSTDIQYLDATYDSFVYLAPIGSTPVVTGCRQSVSSATLRTVDCSGRPTFNSPKWTTNFGAEQTFTLNRFKLVASADTQYRSSRYVGFDYTSQERQSGTWQTNAELTLTPDVGRWSLQAYVRNLENTRYDVNANLFGIGNLLTEVTNPPRTYGVRVSYRY